MKQFFSKYSYKMVNVFVTQFAISIFGNVLALTFAKNVVATVLVSAFAVLFNLFLVYTSIWETGSKDKPAIDAGRSELKATTGLFIALGSYIPTYILTAVYAALLPTATTVEGTAAAVCAYVKLALYLFNGAYTGIMSAITVGGQIVSNYWWTYLIISLPTIIVCIVAYIFGAKDIHFTKLMIPPTPEEQEIKKELLALCNQVQNLIQLSNLVPLLER